MSNWADDPQLYLYTKGDDVYLWRCNKTKNSMPMRIEDFDDLGKVTNHLDLVGLGNTSIINWDRDNYINLVKYISSMHLLVNSHGLVIVELNKYTVDGKIDDNQSPVYLRALDVLPLERFNLRERPIPPRMAHCLEGDGTRDAPVVEVRNVQQEYLSNVEKRVTDLEGIVTKLTEDLAVQTNGLEASQQELNLVKSINEVLDTKISKLQAKVRTALVLDWMNEFTDSKWFGIDKLDSLTITQWTMGTIPWGTYTDDENTSNVRAAYICLLNLGDAGYYRKAIAINDLIQGKEKARFSKEHWCFAKC